MVWPDARSKGASPGGTLQQSRQWRLASRNLFADCVWLNRESTAHPGAWPKAACIMECLAQRLDSTRNSNPKLSQTVERLGIVIQDLVDNPRFHVPFLFQLPQGCDFRGGIGMTIIGTDDDIVLAGIF